MLSFANVYFFGSGLFNGLQPIQIKNFCPAFAPTRIVLEEADCPKAVPFRAPS
jgi:hypothetical protein